VLLFVRFRFVFVPFKNHAMMVMLNVRQSISSFLCLRSMQTPRAPRSVALCPENNGTPTRPRTFYHSAAGL
jgi:hypothetical protein